MSLSYGKTPVLRQRIVYQVKTKKIKTVCPTERDKTSYLIWIYELSSHFLIKKKIRKTEKNLIIMEINSLHVQIK